MNKIPEISAYETAWLNAVSAVAPAVQAYLGQSEPSDFEQKLRFERNQLWLRAALASLHGEEARAVCSYWSDCADRLLREAFTASFGTQKIALFALGKLGSHELNLSSDVDVLLVMDNEMEPPMAGLRRFQKILSERGPAGFVFRVDFDLRPGGKQGPLIPTVDQLKDYYGNYGETWERLAFVRLRQIAGSADIGRDVLAFARKFTFRRHLDFTLLEDLKHLRKKIHAHYWTRSQGDQLDLKLGIGGIRDVELFVHALQVVHGGKDPSLQVGSTHEALELIAAKKLLPEAEAQFLQQHYWNLRALENYVQAQRDEQNHLLRPVDAHPEFVQKLLAILPEDLRRCDHLVSGLLGEAPARTEIIDPRDWGLSEKAIAEHWDEILQQEVLSRSKDRDESARLAFLDAFLKALKSQGGDLDRGLGLLKDFIKATRAKATFFSLLLREKVLLNELAWLFGHSPYLARLLCLRPELLDSFVYRSQDKVSEDWSLLLEELSEKKLLSELISGSQFLRERNVLALTDQLSSTADAIVLSLLQRLRRDYHSSVQILALGKWGGREMGLRSDLDFIFVLCDEPREKDFKLVRRLISRLTDPQKGGSIYNIDMRLRPSGKAGPLIIPLTELQHYLREEASPWERQAYLKARWLEKALCDIPDLYIHKGLSPEELRELDRIRRELAEKANGLDLKYSPGGLIDIEFAAQILCLEQKQKPTGSQTLDFLTGFGVSEATLKANYLRLRQIEQTLQLIASENLTRVDQNHESFPFLATSLQVTPNDLWNELNSKLAENLQILNDLDPRRGTH